MTFFTSRLSEGPWLELSDGRLVEKAMPTLWHASIVRFIFKALDAFVDGRQPRNRVLRWYGIQNQRVESSLPGRAFLSARPTRPNMRSGAFNAVDLVVEVFKAQARATKILHFKPIDYAVGKVQEYWIVDPEVKQVTVLKLTGSGYTVLGEYKSGEKSTVGASQRIQFGRQRRICWIEGIMS